MKQIRFLAFSLLLVETICRYTLCAQTKSDAENFYNSGAYEDAKIVYASLLKKKPKDPLLNFCYGKCLYSLNDLSAKQYFALAEKKYPQAHRLMGDLYFTNYQFNQAAAEYTIYLENNPNDSTLKYRIQQCKIGSDMLKRVERIQLIDSIVVEKKNFVSYYNLSVESGTLTQLSAENTTYTTERGDRKFYSQNVNNQTDLFYTYLLINDWSEPTLLSKTLSTHHNESFPFMMADGVTLYFASDNPEGLGGYDIYMSRFSSVTNDYLPAQNIGMPFNSPANDYLFAVDETNNIGLFATDRNQSQDSVAIYRFKFNKQKNIIKDVDTTTLCLYAQLKKYKKADLQNRPSETKKTIESTKQKTINFVVNSETTYFCIDEFKSTATREKFLSLQALKDDFLKLQTDLKQKRSEYASCSDEAKVGYSFEILTIEKELLNMHQRIKKRTIELRTLENKNINL